MLSILNILIPALAFVLVLFSLWLSLSERRKDYLSRQMIANVAQVRSAETKLYKNSLVYLAPGLLVVLVLLFYFSEWQRAIGFMAGGIVALLFAFLQIRILSSGILGLTSPENQLNKQIVSRPVSTNSLLFSGFLSLFISGVIILGINYLYGLALGIVLVSAFLVVSSQKEINTIIQSAIQRALVWLSLAAISVLVLAVAGKGSGLTLVFLPIIALLVLIVFFLFSLIARFLPTSKNRNIIEMIHVAIVAALLLVAYLGASFWPLNNLESVSSLRVFLLLALGLGTAITFQIIALFLGSGDNGDSASSAQTILYTLIVTSLSVWSAHYFAGLLGVALSLAGAIGFGLVTFLADYKTTISEQLDFLKSTEVDSSEPTNRTDTLSQVLNMITVIAFLVLGQAVFGRFLSAGKEIVPPLVFAGGLVGVGLPLLYLSQRNKSRLRLERKAAFNIFGLFLIAIVLELAFGLSFFGGVLLASILSALTLSGSSRQNSPILALFSLLLLLIASSQASAISEHVFSLEWRLGVLGFVIIVISALLLFVWRPIEPEQKKSL